MDTNQMTRVVGNQRIPVVVIDTVTGERLRRHAVDAKEMIGDGKGRYVWALDVAAVKVPEIKVDANGAPIALVDVPMPAFVPDAEMLAATGVATTVEATTVEDDDDGDAQPVGKQAKKGKGKATK